MYLLAIDLGTTSVKVSLFDPDASVIGSYHKRVKTKISSGGGSRQDAGVWLQCVVEGVRSLTEKFPDQAAGIAGIAATGHMMGCLPVDRDGKPLFDHMLHSDTSARHEAEMINELIGSENFYQMTGNILNGSSVLPKIIWFRNNHPELYKQTSCFLNSKDFITGFLTGTYGNTDLSDASHSGIIDIRDRSYNTGLYQSLKLTLDKMPDLHTGTEIIGKLCRASAKAMNLKPGIPVATGAGDGACSAIGAGAGKPGDVYCCMGTTAWIASITSKPVFDSRQRSFNIIAGDGKAVGSYGTIQNCGRSTDFALDFFKIDSMQEFDRLAGMAPAGSLGLIYLPYLDGERGPLNDPDTQGVFFGINTEHNQTHGLRSVLEGVAMALRHNADVHRENGCVIDKIKLIGGGARSKVWREIMAGTMPATISRVDVPPEDATTLGAAMLAGIGIGLYKDLAEATSQVQAVGETRPLQDQIQIYNNIYEIYCRLYPALKEPFHMMAEKRLRHLF